MALAVLKGLSPSHTMPLLVFAVRGYASSPIRRGSNLIEKIARNHLYPPLTGAIVRAGDIVSIQPKHVMTHDNTAAVMSKFLAIAGDKQGMFSQRQVVFTLDHDVQNKSEANLKKYKQIQEFAKAKGVDFYPAGRGIGHQVMCEEGYILPGSMVVASDSHSNMYGGLGCLGTPVVRTDAAAIWATGRTWWQVPPVAKVNLVGSLPLGVTGKDVIIALCGLFNDDQVLNHAVEFSGPGLEDLSIDARLTIANMTTEWGALAGVFPADNVTFDWLEKRADSLQRRIPAGVPSDQDSPGNGENPRLNKGVVAKLRENLDALNPDPNATYAKILTLDLSTVQPHVSGPNEVKVMTSVAKMEEQKIKVHKAYIVSCVNSRFDDLKAAAKVLEGKRVHPDVELYIAAASSLVQDESEQAGHWNALIAAGARPLPPGCGPCVGLGAGLLKDGEVGISATNRNFRGRMGSRNSEAYLASPSVVAASAAAGYICSPTKCEDTLPRGEVQLFDSDDVPADEEDDPNQVVEGFPAQVEGHLVWCHKDNLNTDGIYAGKWTYKEGMTPETMAEVAMENYDASFGQHCQKGDILVGGYNFGTGSSREQAATALKYKGISMVIAGSFSETYKRNALNNGLIAFEVPKLVEYLKGALGQDKLTVRSQAISSVDFQKGVVHFDGKQFFFRPLGPAAQELVVHGGLESWVRAQLSA